LKKGERVFRKFFGIALVLLIIGATLGNLLNVDIVKGDSLNSRILKDGYITRSRMMRIAEAYKTHRWNPTKRNIFHQRCEDGGGWIVNTPDRDTYTGWPEWKGWKADEENVGIPYQWGGFSSIPNYNFVDPQNFDEEYKTQIPTNPDFLYHAGDCYCDPGKPKCDYSCGVDCSGFVGRCWNLSKPKPSTRDFAKWEFSWPIKFEELKPGDILNCPGKHVMLFKEFVTPGDRNTPGKTKIRVYEASGKDWKVSEWEYVLKTVEPMEEEWKGIRRETNLVTLEVVGRIDPLDGTLNTAILSGYCDGLKYTPRTYNPIKWALLWLREHQNLDGSWTYSGRVTEESVGLTSMAVTAFLSYGVSESDPIIRKAIDWILSKQREDGCIVSKWYEVYDTSLAILALTATGNKGYYDEIRSATEFLIAVQNDEDTGCSESDKYYGGWPYWKGMADWADLSNTQFAMLALWYAEQENPDDTIVPTDVWEKAEIFVTRCQNRKASNPDYSFYDDGGFIYQPASTIWAGGRSYGSMTAAGLWGLFTCGVNKKDGRVKDAWKWLESNYHIDQNYPIGSKFIYYYLYSFAKACMLWNVESVAGHDWYQEMSEFLINNQQPDGRWLGTDPSEEPDLVATCWALLALETKMTAAGTRLRVNVNSPADLHIYDPLGRHVGINYEMGEVEVEIPGANYSGPETEPQIIEIPNPIAGNYRIRLVGREKGYYVLTIEGMIGNETIYSRSFEGAIDIKEEKELNAIISGIAGPITIDIPDDIPPDVITDLCMIDATFDSITLAWTAPGDDWRTGTASQYEIRYSTQPITEENWDEAFQCEGEPVPQPAGNIETFTVTNLSRGITYYFAIKTADEIPNWSNLSNVAKGFTWSYIFEDTYGRNTTLKININEKAFQFTTSDEDYGME